MRIRGIKGKFEERERDFLHFWRSWKRKRNQRERKKGEGENKPNQKLTSFGERKGDLAFQKVHTLKSSLRVKLGA